jgi:hypothetical protein
MSISRLAFSLVPGGSGPKKMLKMRLDDRDYVTGCFLADDLVHLVKRFAELDEEGRRFDLFFSNASPFSVSVTRRGPDLYVRISDNFDGGILEDRVAFAALKGALIDLQEAVLRLQSVDPLVREQLEKGLAGFRQWQGPVTGT